MTVNDEAVAPFSSVKASGNRTAPGGSAEPPRSTPDDPQVRFDRHWIDRRGTGAAAKPLAGQP